MENIIIERVDGDDYIVNLEHHFTLKAIPPEKHKELDYNGFHQDKFVTAIFEDDTDDLQPFDELNFLEIDDNKDFFMPDETWTDWEFGGVNISYKDDDLKDCNKHLWLETIQFYCMLKLEREVVALDCRGYDYLLNDLNCDIKTIHQLSSITN